MSSTVPSPLYSTDVLFLLLSPRERPRTWHLSLLPYREVELLREDEKEAGEKEGWGRRSALARSTVLLSKLSPSPSLLLGLDTYL